MPPRKNLRKNSNSYGTFVYKVLKEVAPSIGISKRAMDIMDSLVTDVANRLLKEALALAEIAHMQTLRPRDVHTALALIAHPDLCEYVITYHGNLTGKWFKADVDARKVENDEDESSEEVDHSGGDAFSSTADPFSSTPGAFSSFGHSASSATSSSTAKAALEPSSGLVVAGKKKSLIFPVGRLRLSCNQKAHSMRLQASGIVFIASAMQAVAELVLKGATEAATEQQRVRVIPRHILLSIRGHTHLSAFFRNAMIPGAGIVPQMLGQVLDNDLGRPMKKGSGILDSDSEDL